MFRATRGGYQSALRVLYAALFPTILLLFACSREKPRIDPVAQSTGSLSAIATRTYGFESLLDWSPIYSSPTLALSNTRVEGLKSLSVSGGGWSSVISRALSKEEAPPSVVGFDLRIPLTQPNSGWFGTVELFIDAPSVGINNQPLGL